MANNSKIGFIILIVIVVILIGSVVYVWNTKTQEINNLNKETAKLEESFKLVKFSCLFNLPCKEDYNEKLRQQFIKSNNLGNAQYQSVGTRLNYHKYFLEPIGSIDLSLKLRDFIEANCPEEIYKTPGKLFSSYTYNLDENELSIMMDEETVDIICSWIYDKSTDTYSQP